MAIIRIQKHKRDFTLMANEPFNEEMSYGAKGLLAYLLTKPDTWTVRMKELEKKGPDGWRKVQSYMAELRDFGYADLVISKDEKTGKMCGKEWVVREVKIVAEEKPPIDPPARDSNGQQGQETDSTKMVLSVPTIPKTDDTKNRLSEKPTVENGCHIVRTDSSVKTDILVKTEEEKEEALALPSNPSTESQIKIENPKPQPETKPAEQPQKETPQIAAAPLIEDVEVEDLFTEPKTDEIDPAQIIVDKIMKAPRVKKEMWYVRHGVNGDLPERAYEYAAFYIAKYCMEIPEDSLIPYLQNANSKALQSGFEMSWLRNLKRYAPKLEEMTEAEKRKKRDYDIEQYCLTHGLE